MSLNTVHRLAFTDNFLNSDLRSLLSTFDWDLFSHGEPREVASTKNSSGFAQLFFGNRLGSREFELIPLESLSSWGICEYGIDDLADTGVWVDMFNVRCIAREVAEWQQPLMCCSNRG